MKIQAIRITTRKNMTVIAEASPNWKYWKLVTVARILMVSDA